MLLSRASFALGLCLLIACDAVPSQPHAQRWLISIDFPSGVRPEEMQAWLALLSQTCESFEGIEAARQQQAPRAALLWLELNDEGAAQEEALRAQLTSLAEERGYFFGRPALYTLEPGPLSSVRAYLVLARARTKEPSPKPLLREKGRFLLDGEGFGLAIDEAGQVLVNTVRGLPAVYLASPSSDTGEALASYTLSDYASIPLALSKGIFAVSLYAQKRVLLVRASSAEGIALVHDFELPGNPGSVAVAFGMLWIAIRNADDNSILMAFDPSTGALLERLESVAIDSERSDTNEAAPEASALTPIELLSARDGSLLLTGMRQGSGNGELALLTAPKGEMQRVLLDGMPMRVLETEAGKAWLLRHQRPDILALSLPNDEGTGRIEIGGSVQLPFVPQRLVMGAGGEAWALSAEGRLAHLQVTQGKAQVLHERECGVGSHELLALSGTELLFLLDARRQTLVALRGQDLETLAELELHTPVARMVLDEPRRRLLVSLPLRAQLAVIEYSPALAVPL